MTHVLTIAAREIRERTFVLWTAAAVALLPFFAQALPGIQRWPRADIIAGTAGILASAVALGLAVLMGGTFIARDLADRRLSFYFSRPVSASSLWFGKLLGATVLSGLVFAIISIPSLIVARSGWKGTWGQPPHMVATLVLGLSVLLILVAHAASTMFRARSTVLIADLILIVLFGAASWMLIQSFLAEGASGVVKRLILMVAVMTLAGLLGAGAWQLSRGRTDVKRNHREMSKFLWCLTGAGVILAALFAWWVRSASLTDLEQPRAGQNGTGEFAIVRGVSRGRAGYMPTFLVDTRTGQSTRLVANTGLHFTRNGNAVFGITETSTRTGTTGQLRVQRLGRDAKPETMPVTLNGGGDAVVSDDLSLAAVQYGPLISVYRIADGRLLASARLPDNGSYARAFFPSNDVLRVLLVRGQSTAPAPGPYTLRVLELDIPKRRLTTTGLWQTTASWLGVTANADGSMLIARRRLGTEGTEIQMLDGRTAMPGASLPGMHFRPPRLLSDGRLAGFTGGENVKSLSIFSKDGALERQIVLPGKGGYVAGEAGRGKLVVVTRGAEASTGKENGRGYQTVVLDIDRGTVLRKEEGSYPPNSWSWKDPRSERPNTSGDYLLTDRDGVLWRWNALTGSRQKLAG